LGATHDAGLGSNATEGEHSCEARSEPCTSPQELHRSRVLGDRERRPAQDRRSTRRWQRSTSS